MRKFLSGVCGLIMILALLCACGEPAEGTSTLEWLVWIGGCFAVMVLGYKGMVWLDPSLKEDGDVEV